MELQVEIVTEGKRGCGYRKAGATGVGVYLMGDGIFEPCPRLPFPLSVCPCCGGGVKFSRGFTWVAPSTLFATDIRPLPESHGAGLCPLCNPVAIVHLSDRAGLIWVGNKYYSPQTFAREAQEQGISKKVAAVPNGFEIGEHFIFLAHNHAVPNLDDSDNPTSPGVFMVFRPQRVDLVIDSADKIPDRARSIAERLGDKARLIQVIEGEPQQKSLL